MVILMKYGNIFIILLLICLFTMGAVNATNETTDIQTDEVTSDTSINNNDVDSIEKTITKTDESINDIKTSQDSNIDYSSNQDDLPISDVYTIVTDNVDAHWDTEIDLFADVFAENKTVNGGKVYFQIDGKPILDKNGAIVYSSVQNNLTHQKYYVPATLALEDHNITAIYLSTENTRAIDTKTFTITDDHPSANDYDRYEPDTIYDPAVISYTLPSNTKNNDGVTSTVTHKIIHNNNIISQSNSITLKILNKIFGREFLNGQLLVYIDGELVYNGTTTDDLSSIIFEIIEKFIGEHEIKVEFTDSNNKTDTCTENITIE